MNYFKVSTKNKKCKVQNMISKNKKVLTLMSHHFRVIIKMDMKNNLISIYFRKKIKIQ